MHAAYFVGYSLLDLLRWLGKWKEARIDFCTKKNKVEVKKFGKDVFEAPMTDMSSDHFLGFDLDKAIRHVERTIADLCTYYKPLGNECPLSTALSPSLTGEKEIT